MLPIITALAFVGITIAAYSIYKKGLCRRLYRNAIILSKQGNHGEALALLVKAESNWSLNSHNGGRNSILQDLELLAAIANEASSISSTPKSKSTTSELVATVTELKDLFDNRSNFGIDGRSMKSEAAKKWALLAEKLALTRRAFRLALEKHNL